MVFCADASLLGELSGERFDILIIIYIYSLFFNIKKLLKFMSKNYCYPAIL